MTCCFTGHRPGRLPAGKELQDLKIRLAGEILRLINERGVTRFITGMALGVDTMAADIVLTLKAVYPFVTLEAAVPCKGQEKNWSEKDKAHYKSILESCDRVEILSESYCRGCMQMRNAYMVNEADIVLAVWDGGKGGTANTVNTAKKLRKELILLPPNVDSR